MKGSAYRAALIGLGNIAWRFDYNIGCNGALTHASAYALDKRTELVGGCSNDPKDRIEFERKLGVPAYSTVEKMIKDLTPDIVSVCSPSSLHFEHVQHCLKNEVPMIWLEKPPADSISQVHKLIEEQRISDNRSTILVNYQRRYTECYKKLATLFKEKVLGHCKLIIVTYSKGLEANGSHMLDIVFFIVSDDREYKLVNLIDFNISENPSFALSFEEGPDVIVLGIDLPYHCIDISLVCDRGRASILHGGMTPMIEKMEEHVLFPGFFRLKEKEKKLLGRGSFERSMLNALGDLIDSHNRGKRPRSDLETARKTQSLIDEIKQRSEFQAA